jgi:methylated-DNA-[protein]-cysteine S-methyltransferase
MDDIARSFYKSPVGILEIAASNSVIISVSFAEAEPVEVTPDEPIILECKNQLELYFNGQLKEFNLPLKPSGSEFQKKVWEQLLKIPFGTVVSYEYIARKLGDAGLVRAVGMANNKNRIPIIIPCHRVVGKNGEMIGYGGGIWRKKWLLQHERKFSAVKQMELFNID